MISGLLELMSQRLRANYLDVRYGLVVPQSKYESNQSKKVVPACHVSNKLVAPDDKKMTVLWFEREGNFAVNEYPEYMEFQAQIKAVLWINKSRIDKDDPFVEDKVSEQFARLIRDFKLKGVDGYNIEKITITAISNDPAKVFNKYTLNDMVNFTNHPYSVCSVDFNLTFNYCASEEIRINPKC